MFEFKSGFVFLSRFSDFSDKAHRVSKKKSILISIFLLSAFTLPDHAIGYEKPAVFEDVIEVHLDNGMLFLLLPRHDVPVISGQILVKVGNVDNQVGQTGLAHMFEHMAFKGTDRIGTRDWTAEKAVQDSVEQVGLILSIELSKGLLAATDRIDSLRVELDRLTEAQIALTVPNEFPLILESHTFDFNASTSEDFTRYYMEVPANRLELWMLMESERFQFPSYREFYRELEIVKEERRQRTDDNPRGLAWEQLQSLAFSAHPYRFPTIGYMSDLEALNHEQAMAFRNLHYVPENAIGVLVGDFEPERTKELLQDYFGDIPAGPLPPPIPTREPPRMGLQRGQIVKGTEPGLFMAFPGFHPKSRKARIAELLSSVLSRDRTSRLDKRLDIQEHAVQLVSTSSNWGLNRYPGIFTIQANPLEGFSNETVEKMIWEELDRLQEEPPSIQRLDDIRSSYRKDYYYSLETNKSLTRALINAQAIQGDWRNTYQRFEEYEDITPEEVRALAAELFQRQKASIVYLEPEEEEAGNE